MTSQKELVRKVVFPVYGNFCLIHALKGLGVEVEADMEKGSAIAIFDCSDIEMLRVFERFQKILTRHYAWTSASA